MIASIKNTAWDHIYLTILNLSGGGQYFIRSRIVLIQWFIKFRRSDGSKMKNTFYRSRLIGDPQNHYVV